MTPFLKETNGNRSRRGRVTQIWALGLPPFPVTSSFFPVDLPDTGRGEELIGTCGHTWPQIPIHSHSESTLASRRGCPGHLEEKATRACSAGLLPTQPVSSAITYHLPADNRWHLTTPPHPGRSGRLYPPPLVYVLWGAAHQRYPAVQTQHEWNQLAPRLDTQSHPRASPSNKQQPL